MSKSIESTVLERAMKIMEAGWTQDNYAEDERGEYVPYWSKKAVAFCAVGAIYRATMEVTGRRNMRLARKFEDGWAAVRRVMRRRLKAL